MNLTSRGIFLDAVTLWRAERPLLVPVAGLFFVVPMLGLILLLSGLVLPETQDPQKFKDALTAFYDANLLPIMALSFVMDFGSFVVFNLFLQGGGRTLGEVLLLSLRRFPFFFVLNLIVSLAFSIGFSAFFLPGLFILARTWLAGPAYAAEPELGLVHAFRQGWKRSGGLGGFALLGLASMLLFVAFALVIVSSGILATVAVATSLVQPVAILSNLVTALLGGGVWTALALIRVAAYRLSDAPRQGI